VIEAEIQENHSSMLLPLQQFLDNPKRRTTNSKTGDNRLSNSTKR